MFFIDKIEFFVCEESDIFSERPPKPTPATPVKTFRAHDGYKCVVEKPEHKNMYTALTMLLQQYPSVHLTRIDWAIDMLVPGNPIRATSGWHQIIPQNAEPQTAIDAPAGHIQLCLYNKHQESPRNYPPGIWRWEMRFWSSWMRSRMMATRMRESSDLFFTAAQTLHHATDRLAGLSGIPYLAPTREIDNYRFRLERCAEIAPPADKPVLLDLLAKRMMKG